MTNCEKEDVVIENSQQTENHVVQKSAFEKLSINDLKFDNNFRKVVKDFEIENDIFSSRNFRKSSSTGNSENNYVIDTSSVIKIQQDDYTSYTFAIKRDNQEVDILENLVIEQKNDSVQGFFMKCKFSQKYLDGLTENKSIPFDGTIQRSLYKNDINKLLETLNNPPSNKVQTKNVICIRTTVTVTTNCQGEEHHRYGDESCPLLGSSQEATQTTISGDMCYRTEGGNPSSWSDDYNPSNNGTAGGYNPNGSNTGINDPYDEERALSKRADKLSSKLGLNSDQRNFLRGKNEAYISKIETADRDGTLISAFPFVKYPEGSDYASKYSKLTDYLKNELPKLGNDTFIKNSLKNLYNNDDNPDNDLTDADIEKALTWGDGPVIEIIDMPCCWGAYGPLFGYDKSTLILSTELADYFEQNSDANSTALDFYLGMIILHEYVHYTDNIKIEGEVFNEVNALGFTLSITGLEQEDPEDADKVYHGYLLKREN